ncbi:hypothetical protein P4O66_020239 [Electrophorus voltai]|uniref:ribonuclease H n=1 Tax=Electrophorus voltai TaxID=2609070 RepID=A0AAD8ZS47_9TELE|nr:hypothetical protein P4O66_020239 [Electrophorus voltai]
MVSLQSMSIESPEADNDLTVPQEYSNLAQVFSPTRATQLPPHRDWDYAITLKEGTVPPRCRVYPLSQEEEKARFHSTLHLSSIRKCLLCQEEGQGIEAMHGLSGTQQPVGAISSYLVLPYGLATAPSIFQAYINEVLREYLGRSLIIYIDDILIYSSSWDQPMHDIWAVLCILLQNHLYCKLEKCEFHHKEVSFLGYIICKGSVRMQPCKMEAVRDGPTPQTHRELQRFLGFDNFCRCFIKSFSMVARPLTDLLHGAAKRLKWGPEAEKSFLEQKEAFSTAPVLQQPDPGKPFMVEVDALDVGVGVILSQHQGKARQLKPVAYFSRKLSPMERN